MLFHLAILTFAASLVLGGGTRGGFLSDAALQLIAIPLLLAALWHLRTVESDPARRRAAAVAIAIALLPLLQLVPIPPSLWASLPGRDVVATTFELLDRAPPWMPLSMTPNATWLSALSVLPPLGVFLGTLLLGPERRRSLSLIVLAAALASVTFGLLQLAQGPASALRLYAHTNPTEAVGFFANRNHFSAFLYAATLFAAAWTVEASMRVGTHPAGERFSTASVVPLVAGFTLLVALVAGQTMARSRAGLALATVALVGAFLLAIADRRKTSGAGALHLIGGAVAFSALLAVQYALYRIMERFEADPLVDSRIVFAANTLEAAKTLMPVGSGLGSFVTVYGLFEQTQDVVAPGIYANHAHNDFLELWMETGVLGLLVVAVFVAWLAAKSWSLWRRQPGDIREIDLLLARAASIVLWLLLAHSIVDYPLRTGALMAVFAFASALLVIPAVDVRDPRQRIPRAVAVALGAAPGGHVPSVTPVTDTRGHAVVERAGDGAVRDHPKPPAPVPRRWGADLAWPEAWQSDADVKTKPSGGGSKATRVGTKGTD